MVGREEEWALDGFRAKVAVFKATCCAQGIPNSSISLGHQIQGVEKGITKTSQKRQESSHGGHWMSLPNKALNVYLLDKVYI